MTADSAAVLALIAMLQVKHVVCDFMLQSRQMTQHKGTYGHPAGLLHAGLHAVASFAILLGFGLTPAYAAAIAVAEFVVHYHCDVAKDALVRRAGWTTAVRAYWVALGVDQGVHQLTYVAMAAAFLAAR